MKMQILLLTLCIVSLLLVPSHSQMKINRQLQAPSNITLFQSSLKQQFIAVGINDTLKIYNGYSSNHISDFSYDHTVTAVAFDQKAEQMAVTFTDGSAKVYRLKGGIFNQIQEKYSSGIKTTIVGVCFVEGIGIVFGYKHSQIVLWANFTDIYVREFDNQYVKSVACSKSSGIFAVSGGGNTAGKIGIYEFANNGTIQQIQDKITADIIYNGCTFNQNQDKLYSTTSNGSIFVYNVSSSFERIQIIDHESLTSQSLQKIQLSSSERLIVTYFTNTIAILNTLTPKIQLLSTLVPSFSLSKWGNYLTCESQQINSSIIMSECSLKQYVDQADGECLVCNSSCQVCMNSQNECYLCESSSYLLQNRCRPCSEVTPYCQECTSQTICKSCTDSHRQVSQSDGKCVCRSTYYQKQDVCAGCEMYGCLHCANTSFCLSCDSPSYILNTTSNRCECPLQYYYNGYKCTDCPQGCTRCTPADQCWLCADGFHLNNTECVKNGISMGWIIGICVGVPVLALGVFLVVRVVKRRRRMRAQNAQEYENLE